MKGLLVVSFTTLLTGCYSSVQPNENFFDWSVISVDEEKVDDDGKSITVLYTKEEKVNIYDDLFNANTSIKYLKNFDRTTDGNNRLTEVKTVFKECNYRTEIIGAMTLKRCVKGTGIDVNSIKKSASITDEMDRELIKVSYEKIDDALYMFDTVINKSIGLDWVSTHLSYNINTKVGNVSVGFLNGDTMICDNYMPNSIHTCEYRGIKKDIPPTISDAIFSELDYKANEKFVDTNVRLDQEVAEQYLNHLQGSGLY